jgi:hypothetical protein
MKYMLLLWGDESQWTEASEEELAAQMVQWDAFTEELTKAGGFVSGEGLQPTPTATTLRVEDGERILTDGPFVETKEQLGGFYVIDCKDLDEAIEWAAKTPTAQRGSIEIRPVIDYEAYGMEDTQRPQEARS